MLLSLRATLSWSVVLGVAVTGLSLSGCSCNRCARDDAPVTAIGEQTRGANQADAGMVIYRDPQSGEITDLPTEEAVPGIDSGERSQAAEPRQPQALPGGGVMIKADDSMQPY